MSGLEAVITVLKVLVLAGVPYTVAWVIGDARARRKPAAA